jgi:kynureninase
MRGVEGHHKGRRPWLTTDEEVQALSVPIVGAAELSEVCIMNSLTVNLHLLAVALYRPTQQRHVILLESGSFPSDLYAMQSQARLHGFDPEQTVRTIGESGAAGVDTDAFVAKIERLGDSLALVLLPAVQYYTGYFFDIARIAEACRAAGAVLGVDAAHAVGNVPLFFHDWGVDFAVWCSYKYLNAGPGGIGGAFVHTKHHEALSRPDAPRLAGWWGHDAASRFDMRMPFSPERGASGMRLSNPPVLPVVCLLASLRVFADAGGMAAVREASVVLTAHLESLVLEVDGGRGLVSILTPRDPLRRGAQLSLLIGGGKGKHVAKFMEENGIVIDYREPDAIRVSPAPLYNTREDCGRSAAVLRDALQAA